MNAKDALEALQNAPPVKMVRFCEKGIRYVVLREDDYQALVKQAKAYEECLEELLVLKSVSLGK